MRLIQKKYYQNYFKDYKQRGVVLYMVVIMLAVLMGFSLSVAFLIVTSSKITSTVADSIKAFHCADSGVEYALCRVNTNCYSSLSLSVLQCQVSPGTSFSGNLNDSNYTFSGTAINSSDPNCGTGTTIKSTGTYKSSIRKVEINY
ncbi:MAG TPA: hypothetical protein PL093_01895 [Candidatus Pacearchaeota archaeon]|jgi:Tfp pilus assembly protein PilX|nr:hypothetical protein [Candidatus Pacearchaeota archaeon]HRR94890.1 hypothetical protein [Candidatus Paceibacterota bacterium]HPC30646.1 hypothetical protein [Candidatus Pacearchaeota archaeon]HQG09268.1 hypothetical protein [Candidatus Pacearchaeota archaeon]HQH20309.1 hypothetical protein [Candidatus Pacearchaeota archaeon]